MLRNKSTREIVFLAALILAVQSCGESAPTQVGPPPPAPNGPPTTAESIPDQALVVEQQLVLDVANAFTDPDGDALTYVATTSSAAVVTVTMTGSELSITGVAAGTATVTVSATDPGGLSASQNFAVEVAAAVPTRLTVTPPTAVLTEVGQTVQLSAAVFDQLDRSMSGVSVAWSTGDSAVATVDVNGLVTAVGNGEAAITAEAGDAAGVAAITVDVATPSVSITTLSAAAPEGEVAVVAISVSPPPETPLLATYSLVADDDDGTSDADATDYDDPAGGVVTIAAGENTTEIHIAIVDDDQIEPPREVLVLRLDAATDGKYRLGSQVDATVTIEEGVCDRTPQVRDAIVLLLTDTVSGANCESATSDLLDQIRLLSLNVEGRRTIAALRPNDFDGLVGLFSLDLSNTLLADLPEGVFADLSSLTSLAMYNTQVTELRSSAFLGLFRLQVLRAEYNARLSRIDAEAFQGLTELRTLLLVANPQLQPLPEGVFSDLRALQYLSLSSAGQTRLPPDAFTGMAQLEELYLSNNELETLPTGVFLGLESLKTLWLHKNPGAPFGFPLEIVRTDGADPISPGPARVAVGLASGAPFAMEIALTAHGGELSDSSSSVATGGGLGSEVTVTGTAGVQVVAAAPPAAPPERMLGVEILASEPLVLFAEASNLAPISRHEIQPLVLRIAGPGVSLNAADYFADPDGDELAYTAEVDQDEVVSVTVAGSLATLEPKAVQAAETIVTLTATDPRGLSAELDFTVKVLEPGAGTFNIELLWVDSSFSESQKRTIQEAAARWMAVLADTELPDIPRDTTRNVRCAGLEYSEQVDVTDDLTVLVGGRDIRGGAGATYVCEARRIDRFTGRPDTGPALPALAAVVLNPSAVAAWEASGQLFDLALHEIGHALGIGTLWDRLGLLVDPYAGVGAPDTHFRGRLARNAFDAAGGAGYAGAKVPVQNSGGSGTANGHWRGSVFPGELMQPGNSREKEALSAITIQSLADLGYSVDVTAADPYKRLVVGGAVATQEGRLQLYDAERDVPSPPLVILDREGRVVEIIRR